MAVGTKVNSDSTNFYNKYVEPNTMQLSDNLSIAIERIQGTPQRDY